MMLFYPMLTSKTVSKNITLAICKTLEKYLLIYETESILKKVNANLPRGSRVLGDRKGFYLKESLDEIQEASTKDSNYETGRAAGSKGEKEPQTAAEKKEDKKIAVKAAHFGQTKVEIPFKETFSIEPTYMNVETPSDGKQILGIKVIPYPVKSEGDLVALLLGDRYAPLLVKGLRMVYRYAIKLGWAFIRGLHIPFLGKRPVTGRAVPDIIHAATKHSDHIFVLLNQSEIENSDFLDEPRNINRLFKQGWSSFVIADDVNKKATFCMKGFMDSGFCTEVNYGYLLASLGKEKLEIYNDLEDLQKKASPFFRLKKPKKKVFEGRCHKTIEDIVVERKVVLENIGTFSKKADKIFSSMQQAVKRSDISTVNKLSTTIPKITLSTIERISGKSSPNFVNSYKLCQSVLKNSTDLSDDKLKAISIIVAFKSTYKITDYKSETKKNLLKATAAIRKTKENEKTGFLKTLFSVAFSLGIILGSGVLSITIFLLLVPLILG